MTQIKAILFDMDGVLIDATEWHFDALNKALSVFGFQITRFDHLSTYNGLPTSVKLERLTIEKKLPKSLHPLISQLKQIYTREEILARCYPSFEKEYLVARLKREGFRLAVCSNSIRETTELMLRRAGILDQFEFFLSNQDVKKPKPAPDVYLDAMKRLSVAPEETLVIEDAPHGVIAARQSGANVCEVVGFEEVNYWKIRSFLTSLQNREIAHAPDRHPHGR